MRSLKPKAYQLLLILVSTVITLNLFSRQDVAAEASSETSVQVEPTVSYANVSETFAVNITVVNVENLYGLEVSLFWSASVLQATTIEICLGVESHPDGVLHEREELPHIFIAENSLSQEQGRYRLSATSLSPAPSFNGSGTMFRVTFNVTSAGSSTLDLHSLLYDRAQPDEISEQIDHVTIDGSFEIVSEVLNVTSLIAFLVLVSLTTIVSKRRRLPRREAVTDGQCQAKQDLLVDAKMD